jgi:hypothetical protein
MISETLTELFLNRSIVEFFNETSMVCGDVVVSAGAIWLIKYRFLMPKDKNI